MPGTYHSRRKSGQGFPANTSTTDVRKALGGSQRQRSSGNTSKRSKEQASHKLGKSPKDRDREYYEYADDGDGRDTFPQYCMACEKQFLPVDDRCLYCSEACREFDENSFHHAPPRSSGNNGYQQQSTSSSTSSLYNSGHYREPKDIIPRASPSRPTSTYFASSPVTPGDATAAISALRSLTIRSGSPPSPTTGSGVGSSLWPFARSAASPEISYPRGGFSSTYDGTYSKKGYSSSGANAGYSSQYSSSGLDRPLPSRRPGGYSRPKSIELVTPMVGR